MKYVPHDYQAHATQHIIDNPAAGLLLDMGLGKTVATLTAIKDLMYNSCEVEKVLVIAPKRVAEDTWPKEVTKWDHLKNLRVSLVLGTPRQRIEALRRKADIYVINRENVVWLVTYFQSAFPFDMLVIDESSSFKNYKSARFKALRSVRPGINRVVNLTGTPTPNGLLDLWSQMYLLDRGQRLGKTISQYRDEYFKPTRRKGHVIYEWALLQGDDVTGEDIYERRIYDKISDICISMKSEDYLDLPDLLEIDVMIDLPAKDMQRYKDFERDLVLCMEMVGLENAEDITAINATALSNKLRQFANGAVYDDEKNWKLVHNVKLAALVEDVEDLNGKPII
ncbi:DEAD/DEAH box helicase, partial [Candidatus Saccharibacteria bacterium]|nr:DEAD/DEAH box helicase [Candidatus Saccharibacteria bacterium]